MRNHSRAGKQRRRSARTTGLILAAVCVLIMLSVILVTPRRASAGNLDDAGRKYYTSYQVQSGDSLWTIAERYRTSEYGSTQAYVDEVCRINHLSDSDRIYAGRSICIPYYTDAAQL